LINYIFNELSLRSGDHIYLLQDDFDYAVAVLDRQGNMTSYRTRPNYNQAVHLFAGTFEQLSIRFVRAQGNKNIKDNAALALLPYCAHGYISVEDIADVCSLRLERVKHLWKTLLKSKKRLS
jgi:hypothetical protein